MKMFAFLILLAGFPILAEDKALDYPSKEDSTRIESGPDSTGVESEEEWLKTVWLQVDKLVREEDFELQQTVVAAGVRGFAGEYSLEAVKGDTLTAVLRQPTHSQLRKAIEILKKALERNPNGEKVPEMIFYIGRCYEKLAKEKQAGFNYRQVIGEFPETQWAERAAERLDKKK